MMTKCMIPRPVKKGERLTIECVEYVVVGVKKLDAPFCEATLEPYVAPGEEGKAGITPAL